MNKKTKYKMRAECQHDLGTFLQKIPVLKLTAFALEEDCPIDVEVEFVSTKSLDEIRKALHELVDCHVMAETIELESRYTGERIKRLCLAPEN